VRACESRGITGQDAEDIAFHMTDWFRDLDNLNRFFANPEAMTPEAVNREVLGVLVHMPHHLAAAAKLYTGQPVSDVFGIGAVEVTNGSHSMSDHPVLLEAQFDRAAIKKYYLWQPTIFLACTVVLIPVIPIVLLITVLVMDKYLDRLSCTLTERTLELRKGVLNRVESTVPLEKITDLQMFQGPIMRALGLHGFKLETAGQSSGPGGSLIHMIGITDTPAFRKAVLTQRDRLADGGGRTPAVAAAPAVGDTQVLTEIRDLLRSIDHSLRDRRP
jgi:putative membrane protein